jgi:hypothetical protein
VSDGADRRAIRDLVQDWAVWRDAGDWERFATVWHDDGVMMATWFQGPAADFIRVSREGFERGVRILHFLGGTSLDLSADHTRAIAQTKMTITQRTAVHDVEKRDGRWGMVLRQPIYEQDRLSPVSGGAAPALDPERLSAFPVGYRHLAYIQSMIGYDVKPDMPGLIGPEVKALYDRGARWLRGETTRGERP